MNHPSVSPRARRWAAAAALLLVCVAGGAAVLAFRRELWAILTSQAARDQFIGWVQSLSLIHI